MLITASAVTFRIIKPEWGNINKVLQCSELHGIFYFWPRNINVRLEKEVKKELALIGWI